MIYYYLFCDCNGYEGTMCQIDKNSYDYVVDIYKKLLNKVKALQDNKYNKDLIKTIKLLMQSGATFMNIEHMDFMLESVEFINSQKDKFANKMIEGNNYELYFDIFNALIEYGLSLVNKFKFNNFIKLNLRNSENVYNSEKLRKADIEKGDPENYIKNYFNNVKINLQNLLEFYVLKRKEIRFINRNINVYASVINENFPFNNFFDIEKNLYEPYLNFQLCLEKAVTKGQNNPSKRVYFSSIVWKVSPYISDMDLYWDTSSPIVSLKFLDYNTGEKIYISDCGDIDNQIQIYFPINSYHISFIFFKIKINF